MTVTLVRRTSHRTAARPPVASRAAGPARTVGWLASAMTATDWIDAAPFRAHLSFLAAASGLPSRVVGHYCGLTPHTTTALLRPLRHGPRPLRRLPRALAARLLTVRPTDLTALRTRPVAAGPTARRLADLAAEGWGEAEIGTVTGARPEELAAVVERDYCTALTAVQVGLAWCVASGEACEEGGTGEAARLGV